MMSVLFDECQRIFPHLSAGCVLYFIIILKPCNLYLLYPYVPTKLHLNLLY